jgi:hypothetical protein
MKIAGDSDEKVTTSVVDIILVEQMIKQWGNVSQKSAHKMIEKYGPPNEAAPSGMICYNNGCWKRTIVTRDEIPHNSPAPHVDVSEQVINYKVPIEKVSDLAAFDGSVIVERTKGEVAARCDLEAVNFLSLNLMHDIVGGSLAVEQAREKYAESISAYLMNRPAPYSERLLFEPPAENTRDVDAGTIWGESERCFQMKEGRVLTNEQLLK